MDTSKPASGPSRHRYQPDPFYTWRDRHPSKRRVLQSLRDREEAWRLRVSEGIMSGRIRLVGRNGQTLGNPELFPETRLPRLRADLRLAARTQ